MMGCSTRDDYIMESLQQAAPMLQSIAVRSGHDTDELTQVAAEAALLAYPRAQATASPRAYLHRAMRNAVLASVGNARLTRRKQHLADHYRIVSLDAPLLCDATLSLGDSLAEAPPLATGDRDFSRLTALVSALPEISRTAICMRFGLSGYGVHRSVEIAAALGISQDAIHSRLYRVKAVLRACADLQDLVGRRINQESEPWLTG